MRLHIVRHGQTHWNVERRIQGQLDSELDESGIEQARTRGRDFDNMQFSSVYSSSSVRTRQTTEHLLGERPDTVIYRDDLREVCWGIWQGRLWSEIEAAYPEMVEAHHNASSHFSVEGAETSQQTQARGVAAIESIIKQHSSTALQHENLLIVSHGAIMKKILAHYTHVPLTSLYSLPPLPNCAHCIIEVQGSNRYVRQIAGEPIESTQWMHFGYTA